MKRKAITLVLAVGAVLFGCGPMPVRAPLDAAWTRCNTGGSGPRCDIRIVADNSGPYSCGLGRFRVEPDFLELVGNRPVNIQWELSDPFAFCDRDGVDLKAGFESGRSDVFENYNSEGKDGATSGFATAGTCKSFRNWRWGNSSADTTYAYEIRFSDKRTGQRCRIDPFIKNGRAS
ncbi:MAG: hypothetical protein ABI585_00040 [Betaproteobacteria bacterium]